MKYQSRQNYKPNPSGWEKGGGISQTVPDDSYSVQELLDRHENGIALNIKRLANFDNVGDEEFDSIDMEEFQKMEPTEKNEIVNNMAYVHAEKAKSDQIVKARKEKEAAAEAAAKKARIEAKKAQSGQNLQVKKD